MRYLFNVYGFFKKLLLFLKTLLLSSGQAILLKSIILRLQEMQIHSCTVEGAAQTNLLAVQPFWIAEEI